ncbi:hypothetical protein GCM10025857_25570 [Alicyclobacillus contaminans]|uniref:hypothetical protein n=1 Tax=Alicyclobacillus contaminans TaxID=392016 RepID=UPI0003FE84D7|nr:hypothetical protein [Alicyclobacillus contaminans]GMA51200.1 hypothetical protein GCM10025857_25570 [Alicyclobacillus contaminans]
MKNLRMKMLCLLSVLAASTALVGCSRNQASEVEPKHPTTTTAWATPQSRPIPVSVRNTDTAPRVLGQRKFPYPYDAMLALSSDADSETLRKFNLVHEFINTTAMTPVGRGLGLDFADSFFMYNGNNQSGYVDIHGLPMSRELSYFKGVSNVPYAASVINHYIQVGWIDTMHTYGDFSEVNSSKTLFRRTLAVQAIQALKQNGDEIEVWTDHGNQSNVDNFGRYGASAFDSYQQGANPWSPYYHTDVTLPYGIRFVWADGSSDAFGMNSVIYPLRLPDGRRVWGFNRYTNYAYNNKGGPLWDWTVWSLDKQLTPQNLHTLEEKHQYSVVAQHLDGATTPFPLPKEAVNALRLLANEYHQGRILVARTSRLLNYNVAQQYVRYSVTYRDGKAYIDITAIADPVFGRHVPTLDEIRGLTFYTTNPARTVLELAGRPILDKLVQHNASDGRAPSIGIAWFPEDTTNYVMTEPGVS